MRRSSDGNDGSRFDRKRLGFVGDQFAQERNQHDEGNTKAPAQELNWLVQLSIISGL